MLVCSLMGLCPQPYSPGLWKSYSMFYVIGTLGAIQFPVVGYTPLKSLEQLAPLFLFLWMQLVHICQTYKAKNPEVSEKKLWDFYILVHISAAVLGAVVLFGIMPEGYLGPLSSRVRGLFVQHTRTGNPLVDSVAEHQATRDEMYYQYFHVVCYLGPVGFASLFFGRSYSKIFMISYTAVAMYFSRKMIRLVCREKKYIKIKNVYTYGCRHVLFEQDDSPGIQRKNIYKHKKCIYIYTYIRLSPCTFRAR